MRNPSGRSRPAVVLAVCIIAAVLSVPSGLADSAKIKAQLPEGVAMTTAVWTGQYVFSFGGFGLPNGHGMTDAIVRFDPVTREVSTMRARLPQPMRGMGSVWTGRYVYLFSGRIPGAAALTDRIHRYDPETDTLEVMPERLPWMDEGLHAVWTGGYAYLFSASGGGATGKLTRYDPYTGDVDILWWYNFEADGVFSDGEDIYFLRPQPGLAEIYRYNLGTSKLHKTKSAIPERHAAAAAFDGHNGYFFGGAAEYGLTFYKDIYRFDPYSDTVTKMRVELPTGRHHAEAVWTPYGIYVLGGYGHQWLVATDQRHVAAEELGYHNYLRDIVRFDSVPLAPSEVSAKYQADPSTIRISWQSPPRISYGTDLLGYRIFRSIVGGPEHVIAETTYNSYMDQTCPSLCAYSVSAFNSTGEGDRSQTATPGLDF